MSVFSVALFGKIIRRLLTPTDERLPTRMAAVQATQEPSLASVRQLYSCLLRRCIRLNKAVSHLDPCLRRRVLLDGSICVYRNPRADVAVSSIRKMVCSEMVVQPRFPSQAMRSLRLTQVFKLSRHRTLGALLNLDFRPMTERDNRPKSLG
jgi:hypothetical protein